VKTILPAVVDVSICSENETKSIPKENGNHFEKVAGAETSTTDRAAAIDEPRLPPAGRDIVLDYVAGATLAECINAVTISHPEPFPVG